MQQGSFPPVPQDDAVIPRLHYDGPSASRGSGPRRPRDHRGLYRNVGIELVHDQPLEKRMRANNGGIDRLRAAMIRLGASGMSRYTCFFRPADLGRLSASLGVPAHSN